MLLLTVLPIVIDGSIRNHYVDDLFNLSQNILGSILVIQSFVYSRMQQREFSTEHDRGVFCLERFSSELLFYYFNFDLSYMSHIHEIFMFEENILN